MNTKAGGEWMSNTRFRIYDLSKELNLDNKDILAICDRLNIEYKSHSSAISEEDADRVRASAAEYQPTSTPKTRPASTPKTRPARQITRPRPLERKQQIVAVVEHPGVNCMGKFKDISIKGYRRLHDIQLEMRPLTVMIGANGSGKTSFLDVLSILSASANGNLLNTLQKKGGLNEILTRGRAKELEISVSMEVPNRKPLKYSLTLAPKGLSYEIKQETLTQKNNPNFSEPFKYIDSDGFDIKYFDINDQKLVQPTWDHNYLETSLSQVPKMYREPESFRKSIASCTYYGVLDVSEKSPIRLPQAMRPASLPGAQGEDLVSCLYNLRETDSSSFEMLENMLSVAFPDFERLNFPAVAAGTMSMTWKDSTFPKPFYIHELSEGTLRFLWLVTLLQSQELTTITLLDEPEVSLHPELLQHLVYFLREASKRTQVLVATHSDRLVRFLDPKEILVCDIEEGEARMTWAEDFDLEKWLEDYTLDQVWAMNLIGGRP